MIHTRRKAIWLVGFIVLILVMISLGGVTRLTRSGLSIVEWNPVVGIIPPLTESDWQNQFNLYQASPEFQYVNSHFQLSDYKNIFIWEYLHRLLGRVIFLYVLIPGLILWRQKQVEGKLVFSLASLVAAQGAVGWLMVKSGLTARPQVSPYMLALHFFFALVALGTGYYYLSKMRSELPVKMSTKKWALFLGVGLLITLQVFYGCLTSGMHAGHIFNTYPLMGGNFFPNGGLSLTTTGLNIFENPATVQWIHRWLGMLTFLCIIMSAWIFTQWKRSPMLGPWIHLVGITASQIILGISNLVLAVPIPLAVAHQLIASLIVLGYLNILFRLKVL